MLSQPCQASSIRVDGGRNRKSQSKALFIEAVTCIATKVLEGTSNEHMTYIQLRPSYSTILVVNAWIEVHLGGLE